MMKIFLVGVFDIFHYGHLRLFQQAKKNAPAGAFLTVGVQRDSAILKYKPETKIVYDENIRREMIAAIRDVDDTVFYTDADKAVLENDFDIFCIGEDQTHAGFQRAEKWCRENGKTVVRLLRTAGISSSQLKQKIKELP